MTYYHKRIFGRDPIEIIGRHKHYPGYYGCIINGTTTTAIDYRLIVDDISYVTEEQLQQTVNSLNPTNLLYRLNNPHYIKDKGSFLQLILECYDLNPIEQRLWKMYAQTNSQ